MKKLKVADIREAVKQLRGTEVKPLKLTLWKPRLINGIVYSGIAALHPGTFLDIVGEDVFRKIPRDVSAEQIERFIKKWKAKK